jgi:hypothetical protein
MDAEVSSGAITITEAWRRYAAHAPKPYVLSAFWRMFREWQAATPVDPIEDRAWSLCYWQGREHPRPNVLVLDELASMKVRGGLDVFTRGQTFHFDAGPGHKKPLAIVLGFRGGKLIRCGKYDRVAEKLGVLIEEVNTFARTRQTSQFGWYDEVLGEVRKDPPRFTPDGMERAIRSLGQPGRAKARARKAKALEKAKRNAALAIARQMKPSFLALAEVMERLGTLEQRETMWQALGPDERVGKQAAWCKDPRNLGWTGKRKEPGWSTVPPEGFARPMDLGLPEMPLLADVVLGDAEASDAPLKFPFGYLLGFNVRLDETKAPLIPSP